jgi:hypothetical protein
MILKEKGQFKTLKEYYTYLSMKSPLGIGVATIRGRINRDGMSPEEAITRTTKKDTSNHPFRGGSYTQAVARRVAR